MAGDHTYATLIVGAGFTGLGAAIRLAEAGVDDIVILERTDRVGGTWRDTTYPGASCDVPSLLYSYSFVKNPTWSRTYSPAAGDLPPSRGHGDQVRHPPPHPVRPRSQRLDLRRGRRRMDRNHQRSQAISGAHRRLASGPLSDVSFPDIRGLDSYRGHKIHSARWDHDYDFAGKRVAVIGTGASAIQIIPELVKQAEFVKVFQRTPGWVLPRLDVATPPAVQALFAKVPATQQLARQALFWGHEASATASGVEYTVDIAGRAAGASTSAHASQRPMAAPPADTRLRPGLQTHAGIQ